MTIGIVSYMSARGLGTMAHDLRKQLVITKQLVPVDAGWPYVQEWANGDEIYLQKWEVEYDDLAAWQALDDIDTAVFIETPFGDNTFLYCKQLGIKTVLIPMWEHFHPRSPAYQDIDLYLCPSWKCYTEVPYDNRLFLPWPIDTDEFQFRHRRGPAKTFVVSAGSGGMNGRKGAYEAIMGFAKAGPAELGIELIVRSQVAPVDLIRAMPPIDPSLVRFEGPKSTRAELYEEGDVLIYVSHYDGHNLVGLEAMASGMPVITTDAEPMNEYLRPGDKLLVRVQERQSAGTLNPHCLANKVSIDDLAEAIRYCATTDMSDISAHNRKMVEHEHSWNVLRDRWKSKLGIK
jgi:glycosyltransferase involved in cell wall biosynthesis